MEGLTPGQSHFLQGAIALAKKKRESVSAGPRTSDPANGTDALAALTAALRAPGGSSEHADVGAKLAELILAGLPPRAWPRTAKTDALATEIAKLKKKGVR